jgi:glycerol transport system ATP-binding protein
MLELEELVLKPGCAPISHRFEAGQIHVVLGRNHSGKTLLARVIAGLEAPVDGELRLAGQSLNGLSPGERPVALVYQAFVNYPNWTVFENLASPLRSRVGKGLGSGDRLDETSVAQRVAEIAAGLKLTPLLDRRPHTLSGGQQQRLAIGRALAKAPSVLVMDEPLVNLDYKLREAMQLELKALLKETGMSVIYTSSDPHDAFTLGDRLLLLADHALLQAGEPMAVYRGPESVAAADLLCDPRANRWYADDRLAVVRPEHLLLAPQGDGDMAFAAEVLDTETNGSETFLHCRVADGEHGHWIARLDGLVELAPGAPCTLHVPESEVMWFEAPARV